MECVSFVFPFPNSKFHKADFVEVYTYMRADGLIQCYLSIFLQNRLFHSIPAAVGGQ